MAEELNQDYVDHLSTMDRPMAGSSLTNDPDQPFSFEKEPEYTDIKEASEHIFETLIEEEIYIPTMQALADGYPIMNIAQLILFKGFSEGKWNPDLLMLLAEPTAYILMALAERADIDFVIYREEEEDADEEEELFGIKYDKQKLKEHREFDKTKEIPAGAIPEQILSRLDEAPVESLLGEQGSPEEEEEEEPEQPQSLMAPPV